MDFINALELIELDKQELSSIDSSIIKKQKKKIYAEIELSDNNSIGYKGKKLTKSDCEKIISDLEDENKIKFYYELLQFKELNNFLISGDTNFFYNYQEKAILKNVLFLEFISPYFANQYDGIILKIYVSSDENLLKRILSLKPLVISNYIDSCYKSLYNYFKQQVQELELLHRQIRNEEIDEDELNDNDIIKKIIQKIKIKQINYLPEYFSSIKNQIAKSIRDLSVAIFNTFDNSKLSFNLIEEALKIKIDDLNRRKFTEDYKKIKEINDDRINNEQYSNDIEKCVKMLMYLKNAHEIIERKNDDYKTSFTNLSQVIDINYLNKLPDFLKDFQNQIASVLRNLSVEIFNSKNNIAIAINIISLAKLMNIPDIEIKNRVNNDYNTLKDIEKKYKEQIQRLINNASKTSTGTPSTTPNNKSSNWGCFVIIIIIALIAIINNNDKKSDDNSSKYNEQNHSQNMSPAEPESSESSNNSQDENLKKYKRKEKIESIYKGNSLSNGDSPYDHFFGKGIYDYGCKSQITFYNSHSSDVIVCLENTSSGRTIRNEYICAGSNFTMTNLPNGIYKLKAFYGNDWNPEKTLKNGNIIGAFDTNLSFSESDDLITVEQVTEETYNGYSTRYTQGSITLYAVTNGNMDTKKIDEDDFFK